MRANRTYALFFIQTLQNILEVLLCAAFGMLLIHPLAQIYIVPAILLTLAIATTWHINNVLFKHKSIVLSLLSSVKTFFTTMYDTANAFFFPSREAKGTPKGAVSEEEEIVLLDKAASSENFLTAARSPSPREDSNVKLDVTPRSEQTLQQPIVQHSPIKKITPEENDENRNPNIPVINGLPTLPSKPNPLESLVLKAGTTRPTIWPIHRLFDIVEQYALLLFTFTPEITDFNELKQKITTNRTFFADNLPALTVDYYKSIYLKMNDKKYTEQQEQNYNGITQLIDDTIEEIQQKLLSTLTSTGLMSDRLHAAFESMGKLSSIMIFLTQDTSNFQEKGNLSIKSRRLCQADKGFQTRLSIILKIPSTSLARHIQTQTLDALVMMNFMNSIFLAPGDYFGNQDKLAEGNQKHMLKYAALEKKVAHQNREWKESSPTHYDANSMHDTMHFISSILATADMTQEKNTKKIAYILEQIFPDIDHTATLGFITETAQQLAAIVDKPRKKVFLHIDHLNTYVPIQDTYTRWTARSTPKKKDVIDKFSQFFAPALNDLWDRWSLWSADNEGLVCLPESFTTFPDIMSKDKEKNQRIKQILHLSARDLSLNDIDEDESSPELPTENSSANLLDKFTQVWATLSQDEQSTAKEFFTYVQASKTLCKKVTSYTQIFLDPDGMRNNLAHACSYRGRSKYPSEMALFHASPVLPTLSSQYLSLWYAACKHLQSSTEFPNKHEVYKHISNLVTQLLLTSKDLTSISKIFLEQRYPTESTESTTGISNLYSELALYFDPAEKNDKYIHLKKIGTASPYLALTLLLRYEKLYSPDSPASSSAGMFETPQKIPQRLGIHLMTPSTPVKYNGDFINSLITAAGIPIDSFLAQEITDEIRATGQHASEIERKDILIEVIQLLECTHQLPQEFETQLRQEAFQKLNNFFDKSTQYITAILNELEKNPQILKP